MRSLLDYGLLAVAPAIRDDVATRRTKAHAVGSGGIDAQDELLDR
jgi:hypothetical protein